MKQIVLIILILLHVPQKQTLPDKVYMGTYVYSHGFGYLTICIFKDEIVIANESKSIINNVKEIFDYKIINPEKIVLLKSNLDIKTNDDKLRIEDLTWDMIFKDPLLLLQMEPGDTLLFDKKHNHIIANRYVFMRDKKWK